MRPGVLGRLRLAYGYGAVLLAGFVLVEALPVPVVHRWLVASSTDLSHLARDPWLVLPASAVWLPGPHPVYWLVFALVALGALELQVGAVAAAAVAFGVHAVVSVVAELLVGAWHLLDVGPSYLLTAAASAALWRARPWLRALLVALMTPVLVTSAVDYDGDDVAALGHLLSLVAGLLVGFVLWRGSARGRAVPTAP